MYTRALALGTAVLAAGVITVGSGVAATAASRASVTSAPASPRVRATRAAGRRGTAAAGAPVLVREGICTAPAADKAAAARLSAGILRALRGRAGTHGVTVYDVETGISCYTGASQHMDSASIVKPIILAALLRWHQETGEPLSAWEKDQATEMITESGNAAATALWDEVGLSRLRQFLDAAEMTETELGADGLWGLTQVTAHDEMLLLKLLGRPNPVLTGVSRSYELGLMARVVAGERWGTPTGAPPDVSVHVKNGWLGDAEGWHVNSLGVFLGKDRSYMMALLTTADPSEEYGIDTVDAVARVVNRDLAAADAATG